MKNRRRFASCANSKYGASGYMKTAVTYLIPLLVVIWLLGYVRQSLAGSEVSGELTSFEQVPSTFALASILFPANRSAAIASKGKAAVSFAINFDYASSEITPESLPYLDALGKMMQYRRLEDKGIIIEGHADARGSSRYNLALSRFRAKAIQTYLTDVHYIERSRLKTIGKGELEPLNQANPFDAINRRVEFSAWNLQDNPE